MCYSCPRMFQRRLFHPDKKKSNWNHWKLASFYSWKRKHSKMCINLKYQLCGRNNLKKRLFSCVHLIQAGQPGTVLSTWPSRSRPCLGKPTWHMNRVAACFVCGRHALLLSIEYDLIFPVMLVKITFNEQAISCLNTLCNIVDQTSMCLLLLWSRCVKIYRYWWLCCFFLNETLVLC